MNQQNNDKCQLSEQEVLQLRRRLDATIRKIDADNYAQAWIFNDRRLDKKLQWQLEEKLRRRLS